MNIMVHLGPWNSTARNDQCLKRDLAPVYASWGLNREKVKQVLVQDNFGWAARTMELAAFDNSTQLHTGGQ